ncbi:MAG: hypothetical protein RLZZ546_740, partial [Bacteroidota bacterium]
MNYQNFEKKIAEKLYNSEMDTDVADLIYAINNKGNKKRFFLIYLSSALILVALYSLYFINLNNQKKSIQPEERSFLQNIDKVQDDLLPNNTKVDDPSIPIDRNELTLSNENQISSNLSIDNSHLLKKQNSRELSENSITEKNLKGHYIKDSKTEVPSIGDQNTINLFDENDQTKIGPNFDAESTNEIDVSYKIKNSNIDHQISVISLLPNAYENNTITSLYHQPNIKTNKKVECPSFNNKNKWTIGVMPEGGVFLPMSKMKNVGEEQNLIYTLRKSNEKTYEGLQAA